MKRMEHKLEKLPESKIRLVVTLDDKELKKYADLAVANFTKHTEIKGFRSGKAPKHLVVERVGENRINDETINNAVEDSYAKIVTDNEIEVIAHPKIEVVKFVPNQELEYKAEVLVSPEVKLADYKEIVKKFSETGRQEVKIEDQEIKDALNWLINSRAKYDKVERPSQKGDLIVISYESRSDGVKIEGGDQKQFPVILGEGKSVPGLEDELIGLKIGEEKEFSLNISKDFANAQAGLSAQAGKKIDFKVKVDDLMQRNLPELNDEFAKGLGQFENLSALEKNIKDGLVLEKEHAEKERFRIALVSKIAKDSEMEIPREIIEAELDKMIHELSHDISHRGMEFDKYLEHIKKTREDLRKEFTGKAIERVKIALIMREIGKVENIKASDEELFEKTKKVLAELGEDTQNIDQEKVHDYTENIIVNEKVFELLEAKASNNSN